MFPLRVVLGLLVLGSIGAFAWLFWVPARERARVSQREDFVPAGQEEGRVELVEDRPGLMLDDVLTPPRLSLVEVVRPDGRPLDGALVVLFDFDLKTVQEERTAEELTDAEGRAYFDDLDASEVKARKFGYAVGSARAHAERVRITLRPSLAVHGRAIMGGSGAAVGATIRIWDKDLDDEIDLPQVAGEDGGFFLTGIREHHPFILVATYRGHAPVAMELAEPREVLVTFGRGLTLTGDVVDENGDPTVATVVVAPEGAASPFERQSIQLGKEQRELMSMARPNCEQGRFSVLGVKPGAYEVYACGAAGTGKTRVKLDEDRHVEVRLVRPATLVVSVVGPSGEEVERKHVTAHRGDDWEGSRGGEKMALSAGRYVIIANGEGYRGVRADVELRPGEERAIVMRLLRGLAVSGRVVDEKGKPIVDAQAGVNQRIIDCFHWGQHTKSDSNGVWSVRGLAPGSGTLGVFADGYYDHRDEIEVVDGSRHTVRMERRGKIIGRFVPPPNDRRLAVDIDHANGSISTWNEMNRDGSFEVGDPAVDGFVTITLAPRGQTPVVLRDFNFRRGQTHDLGDLRVIKGVTLRLTVLDRAGKPIKGALVEIRDPVYVPGLRTDANGHLEIKDQPQELALRIVADGHAATYRRVNATQRLTIRLARGVAVSGRVWGPNGEPAAHAYVVFWKMRADGSIDDTESWKPEVDGEARFAILLPPGRYRVRVYGKNRQLLPETFEAKERAHFELKMR